MPLVVEEGGFQFKWRQDAQVRAPVLVLVPAKFACQPFPEAGSISIDVVAFLEQHDVRHDAADDRQCLLRPLVDVIGTMEHVPDKDSQPVFVRMLFMGGIAGMNAQREGCNDQDGDGTRSHDATTRPLFLMARQEVRSR